MKFIARFFAYFLSTVLAFLTAAYFLDTFTMSHDVRDIVGVALVFSLLSITVKPLLKLLFSPLILLTFGLFLIIINALLLYVTAHFSGALVIEGLLTLAVAAVIIGVVQFCIHFIVRPR